MNTRIQQWYERIEISRPKTGEGNHWMVRFHGEYGAHRRKIFGADYHPTHFSLAWNDAESVALYYRRAYPGFRVETSA